MTDYRQQDPYKLGHTYFAVCGKSYSHIVSTHDTLREAVEDAAKLDHPDFYFIERRAVNPSPHGPGVVDEPVMSFTHDGLRPLDTEHAVRAAYEAIRSLEHDGYFINPLGVETSEPVIESHLSYAKRALRNLEAAVKITQRLIEDTEREAAKRPLEES